MRKLRKRTVHPHCDAAYRYAKDVLRGKIVVCELTKLACSRFMKDLDDKRWNFNRDRAERFCDFVELMPHVKGKWAGTPLKLEPWQSFIFVNLYGFEDKETGLRRFRRSFVFVPRKNGKGLALDTPIPTPDGWTTMGDLRVGDTLYAEDGSECTVTFVSDHRELDCYEIEFANGEKIVCDGDHLWETQSGYFRTPRVRDTRSMFCAHGVLDNFEIPILGAPSIPIVFIKKVDTVKTKCIQVDSANSLFLCGRTMIPTHNTSISAPLGLGMLTIEAEPGSEVYCLEPSTPVLFGDFIWRPISEVKVGDKLIGFDEKSTSPRKYRKYRPSIVEKKTKLVRPCMKIIFEDGGRVISSLDHSWLTPHTGGCNKNGWKETRDLQVGNSIRYFGEPWGPPLDSFDAGYVSGFFDSEGCIGNGWNKERAGFRISAAQRPNVVLEKVKEVLNTYGVAFSPDRLCKQNDTIRFDIQSAYECFRFLGLFQPKRLIERSEQLYNGRAFNKRQKWRKISAIEDVGEMEVVAIKTSTGTFLADGLCSHNCGATRESQADEVFRPAKAMAERARGFKGVYGITVAASAIHREMGMSFFKRLIGKPGEGQSPYCAIHDEYHEHPTSEQVDSMDTGMGARQEPLQFIITTAGTDTSSPCKDMYDYACKVLDGSFENEQFFALIYGCDQGDDWTDFDVWKKANPNLGVSISEDYLRGKLQEAIQRTSLQNTVKTKHLNVWCNVGVGWMNMAKWVENANPLMRLEDFKGSKAWIGIDLASKVDLTAMMILIFHESRFYLFGKYYLPSETVELKGNEHYQRWALDGILTSTPGARTDYGYLEDDLKAIYGLLEVQEVVYDPREAEYLMQNIREQVSCPVVEFIQSAAQLSEPMKEFEAQYLAGNLIHTGDPVLAWSASNVVLRENRNKLYYPCKERQENKIDPIVAAIMAMARAKASIEDLATQGFVEL